MLTRKAKGKKWFRWVAIVAAIGFASKTLASITMGANVVNTIAANIAAFVGSVLVFGSFAFVLGWIFGGEKEDLIQ
jgi:uncharacterized membrane protein